MRTGLIAFGFVFGVSSPLLAGSVDLGAAGGYAGLMYDGSAFTISSGDTLVDGDVGYGQDGADLTFSGGGSMTGVIDRDPDANPPDISGGSSASGGTQTRDMQPAQNDAEAASTTAAGLTADKSLTSITSSTTLTATDNFYVVDIADNVALSGGTLTLEGNADTFFVLNVDTGGDFSGRAVELSGGSTIDLTGGVKPDHVLFNVMGSGDRLEFNGDSNTFGTFLAPGRDITVSGGVHKGSFISGGSELTFQSGPDVTEASVVPSPSPAVAGAVMLLLLAALRLLRRPRARA